VTNGSGFKNLMRHPGFIPLWIADGLSNFGSFILGLALQFLMIERLSANQVDLGLVRSAQWLPSLLFGLIAGVIVDRLRRKYLLIATDLASAALLSLIAVLAITGLLTIPLLVVLVFLLGSAAVLQGGAHQSFTADLLPPRLLTTGNVALTQTYTAAQTVGPLIGGLLVKLIGAPFAIIANALSYLASAAVLARVPDVDRERPRARGTILGDLRDGIAWVYRHQTLAPYALTLHLWFVGNSIAGTVFVFHAIALGLDSSAVGLTLAAAGVTGVIGSAIAERLLLRFSLGVVTIAADLLTGIAWVIAALAPTGQLAFAALCLAQLSYGFGLGIRGPLEMSYRNAVTPSELRGRMNTTIRSINWGLIAIAAPLGGWLAFSFGDRVALWIGGAIMLASGLALWLSPFRGARMPADPTSPS
jgi:MFS family permease